MFKFWTFLSSIMNWVMFIGMIVITALCIRDGLIKPFVFFGAAWVIMNVIFMLLKALCASPAQHRNFRKYGSFGPASSSHESSGFSGFGGGGDGGGCGGDGGGC